MRREIMRPRRRDGERDGARPGSRENRESSRYVGQVGAAEVTYGRRSWRRDVGATGVAI